MNKEYKEKEIIFKQIKEFDAEIRTIQEPLYLDSQKPFIVEIGIFESLGKKAGDILTWEYNEYPTEEEIRKDLRIYLKDLLNELSASILSNREELQLNVLTKFKEVLK